MPYAAVSSVTLKTIDGRKHAIISVSETLAAAGSEFSVSGLPIVGTIMHYQVTKTAGTGATVNPKIGRAAAFTVSTQDHVATNTTTAAHINDGTAVKYYSPSGILYFRSTPSNAAADHTILTEIVIVEGVI